MESIRLGRLNVSPAVQEAVSEEDLRRFLELHEMGVGIEVELEAYYGGTGLRGSKGSVSFHTTADHQQITIVTELEPDDNVTCVLFSH